MNKKEFALQAILPYYKNPTLCGYNISNGECVYLTSDGRKCVLGKYLLHPEKHGILSVEDVFRNKNQEDILVPEAVGILNTEEWNALQRLHDTIADKPTNTMLRVRINNLGLFTFEELQEAIL